MCRYIVGCFTVIAISIAVINAHCQLPCGLYNDDIQFAKISQDAETISRACVLILQTQTDPNSLNQAIRAINTKDAVADDLIDVVANYFLAQRIVPVEPDGDNQAYERYVRQLVLTNKIIRAAALCKQSSEPEKAEELKQLIQQFQHAFGQHG